MATRSRKSKRRTVLIAKIDFWIGDVMYHQGLAVHGVDTPTRKYLLEHDYVTEEVERLDNLD